MGGGFGDVTYNEDAAAKAAAGGNGGDARAPVDTIDENDPRLTSEDLNVNLEANAYAMPSPPPEGVRYRAKLKLLPVKVKVPVPGQPGQFSDVEKDFAPKTHETKGPYMATGMVATILDASGKYDGVMVYDRWVGTLLNRDGGHKVQTILPKLHRPDGKPWVNPGERLSHSAWIKLFVQALAGEPEIGFEPQWEWSCEACGKLAKSRGGDYPRSVVGMRKFPVDTAASKTAGRPVHLPELKCELVPGHGYSRAQVRVGEVCKASEVPATAPRAQSA